MSHVVIINGSGGVGKDTFCTLCGKFADISVCSSVAQIKKAAMLLGWDGEKNERSRRFLSDLKDLATDYSDAPFRLMQEFITDHQDYDDLIFLMIREPPEIARAAAAFDAVTVLVTRQQVAHISTNHADNEVTNYNYDYIIQNDGDLEQLEEAAKMFVSSVLP